LTDRTAQRNACTSIDPVRTDIEYDPRLYCVSNLPHQ
jgi:hypothetical protein